MLSIYLGVRHRILYCPHLKTILIIFWLILFHFQYQICFLALVLQTKSQKLIFWIIPSEVSLNFIVGNLREISGRFSMIHSTHIYFGLGTLALGWATKLNHENSMAQCKLAVEQTQTLADECKVWAGPRDDQSWVISSRSIHLCLRVPGKGQRPCRWETDQQSRLKRQQFRGPALLTCTMIPFWQMGTRQP